MCTLSLSLLLKTPRGEARYEAAISWSENFRKRRWAAENPGNCGWTPGHFQQAGFPYQMLLGCFWAATHLLPAVCLENP